MPNPSRQFKRSQLHPALIVTALAIIVGLAIWIADRYRHRFVRQNADVAHFLPATDATTFYIDVDAIRRAGYLDLIAADKIDSDSGINYRSDLDAIAGAIGNGHTYFILRGHFDWDKLRRQHTNLHVVQLQSDVLIASSEPATTFNPAATPLPDAPVWLKPAKQIIQNPNGLPFVVRAFAMAIQSADSTVLLLTPSNRAAFELRLDAHFEAAAAADTAATQLGIDTKLVKIELSREKANPNAADLSGLLAGGSFWTQGNMLHANWPVSKQLLQTLEH